MSNFIEQLGENMRLVNGNLVVSKEVTLDKISALINEHESNKVRLAFAGDTIIDMCQIPASLRSNIKNMAVGASFTCGKTTVKKISQNICVSVNLEETDEDINVMYLMGIQEDGNSLRATVYTSTIVLEGVGDELWLVNGKMVVKKSITLENLEACLKELQECDVRLAFTCDAMASFYEMNDCFESNAKNLPVGDFTFTWGNVVVSKATTNLCVDKTVEDVDSLDVRSYLGINIIDLLLDRTSFTLVAIYPGLKIA